MYLHDMLCGSSGVMKFDVKLVVLYFFESLLFLLILKCLSRYFGLPLIGIFAFDTLWLAYVKEAVMFWGLDAFPFVGFI